MGEDNGWRHEVWYAFTLNLNATAVLGVGWLGTENIRKGEVLVACRVALEATGTEVLERAGTIPEALVVAVEYIAEVVESYPTGRTYAVAGRNSLAIGRDSHAPTSEGAFVVGSAGAG
tara:strand:- start:52 stop:405 length:354 start_codon:yes stop_codon:yes gene_type:complete